MKIAIVHNEYGKYSGEEAVVAEQVGLLTAHGHEVVHFTRSSTEIPSMFMGHLQAFFLGIHNPFTKRNFRVFLQQKKPDIIHIHNLFPLISPSILPVCKEMGLPVVMTVHNYRLICPNGLFLNKGKVCERCKDGREYWCVLQNCENNLIKSLGYAARNYVARKNKSYLRHVHIFAALTKFQRQKLIQEGYAADRIEIIPNMSHPVAETSICNIGDYVGYVGRVSPEKGVGSLIEAASKHPDIPFQAAGGYDKAPKLIVQAPNNFYFKGHLPKNVLDSFIFNSRITVMCSLCYEGFPTILVQAMLHGRPVIASNLGGIPEIINDGVTGLLFEAGNAEDLAEKIKYLWDNPDICLRMGDAGRKKALHEYSAEKYYQRLMTVYKKVK